MSGNEERLKLTRRDVMRRAALAGLAVPASGLLAACATPAGNGGGEQAKGTANAENPLGIKEDAPIEVFIFDGGFGDKYAKDTHAPMVMKKHAKVKVEVKSTVEIATVLQPRFAEGNPPDVVNNSGDKRMDYGKLISEDQAADLTPLLDAPSWDDPNKKVRDVLDDAAIQRGTWAGGKMQILWYAKSVFGVWYSQKVFKENGWTAPKDWDEFIALCEEIKKSGKMAPWALPGDPAPQYMFWPIFTYAAKLAGPDVAKNVDNLEPGAWSAEPMQEAAAKWQEVALKYSLDGSATMEFTDVQTAQNRYKAAMLSCGSWLESEQEKSTPKDFEYGMFTYPGPKGATGMPPETAYSNAGEGFIVPEAAKNVLGGMEYLRAMISKEGATAFATLGKTNMSVKDVQPPAEDMTAGLKMGTEALTAAGDNLVTFQWDEWYLTLKEEAKKATLNLITGKSTPKEWGERIDKFAAKVKEDKKITKFTRS